MEAPGYDALGVHRNFPSRVVRNIHNSTESQCWKKTFRRVDDSIAVVEVVGYIYFVGIHNLVYMLHNCRRKYQLSISEKKDFIIFLCKIVSQCACFQMI